VSFASQLIKENEYRNVKNCLSKISSNKTVDIIIHEHDVINRYRLKQAEVQFNEVDSSLCRKQFLTIDFPRMTICNTSDDIFEQKGMFMHLKRKLRNYINQE